MTLDRDTLDRLYRYSYSLAGDEDQAYALLQQGVERYLKASVHADSPVAYIQRIIRNIFIDQRRRQQRFPEVGLDEVMGGDDQGVMDMGTRSLEHQVVAAIDVEAIWKQLAPMEREVLHLWAIEGLTTSEIAHRSETSRNTILSRIHRIRKKLRAWYHEGASGGSGEAS